MNHSLPALDVQLFMLMSAIKFVDLLPQICMYKSTCTENACKVTGRFRSNLKDVLRLRMTYLGHPVL